jgi:hypothetical protein
MHLKKAPLSAKATTLDPQPGIVTVTCNNSYNHKKPVENTSYLKE